MPVIEPDVVVQTVERQTSAMVWLRYEAYRQ